MIERPKVQQILYKVTVRDHTQYYVVAHDAEEAYRLVRAFLDANDLKFDKDREVSRIESIASNNYYDGYEMLFGITEGNDDPT